VPARASRERITVDVANRQRLLRVSPARLRDVARRVFRAEGVREASLGIVLLDDAEMRRLHRQFLGRDTPTDVLTFPLHEPDGPVAAEILLSVEAALREGPRHRRDAETELLLYLTHGILHLCGYDDHAREQARVMRRRQQELSLRWRSNAVRLKPRAK
jgi:probable rRNA maturation factor